VCRIPLVRPALQQNWFRSVWKEGVPGLLSSSEAHHVGGGYVQVGGWMDG
jgi:hypothetical protein